MRFWNFIIFFAVFLTVYLLLHFYIYRRTIAQLPSDFPFLTSIKILFWFFAITFFLGRIWEKIHISWASDSLVWLGSLWLGFIFYVFLLVLAVDLLRVLYYVVSFAPKVYEFTAEQKKTLHWLSLSLIPLLALALSVSGYINACLFRVKKLDLTLNRPEVSAQAKSPVRKKDWHIVAVSDVHLGSLIRRQRLTRLVEKVNALQPDAVLFVGDTLDEDVAPVIRLNLGGVFQRLEAKYGVYGVTGNHEYIGGIQKSSAYLQKHGIRLLRDDYVVLADSLILAGREDRARSRFAGKERKSLQELLAQAPESLPVILMDHQPFHVHQSAAANIGLQISGHTHYGQLWPINYIIDALFEIGYGYKKIKNSHFYVSSGFGTWGPPMRIGNRPEIVHFRLRIQ